MSDAGFDFARRRVHGPGLIDQDRLWRNMLSSQPLAFSIVGELRAHREAATRVLGRLTGLPVRELVPLGEIGCDRCALDGLDAEWAPPRRLHTGDRSGFDIAALLRLVDGRRIFLSVEVRYTDSFSTGFTDEKLASKIDCYRPHLSALGIDGRSGTNLLGSSTTNQYLRSLMLTDSVVRQGLHGAERLDGGMAVVLALREDTVARRAVDVVGGALETERVRTALWSLQDLLDSASTDSGLLQWAGTMRRRYLYGPWRTRWRRMER